MYKGDGSFKTKEVQTQKSLIDLLVLEKEYVTKYNDRAIGIEYAKKNSMKMTELYEELGKIEVKLNNVRQEIAEYLQTNFNTKTSLGDLLYSNNNKIETMEIERRPIGYDNNRNPVYKD